MRAVLALAIALSLWQLAAGPLLPGPLAVATKAATLFWEGGLLADMAASLGRVAVGYSAAAVAGVGLGALVALAGPWAKGIRAVIDLLRPIPPIAWVPLAILWCGLGDPAAWAIVFVGAFFPIFVQVAWALASCPPAYLELTESLGASAPLTLWRVRVPAAAPRIAAGLRTGIGLAWTSVIAAELVGAQSGLGYRIQMHRLMLEIDGVMVGMACIGALGFAMDAVARRLARRFVA